MTTIDTVTSLDQSTYFSSNIEREIDVENKSPRLQGPQEIRQDLSQPLNPQRFEVLNTFLQKMKNKAEQLVDKIGAESNPSANPSDQEKLDRRDKALVFLACLPGVGTGITVFKEKEIAKKLKHVFDPAEKLKLLNKQKDFRVAAIVRTVLSVAAAVLLLAISILTGGLSVAFGLTLIGGAIAVGSGFTGYYTKHLLDTKEKLKPFGEKENQVETVTTTQIS